MTRAGIRAHAEEASLLVTGGILAAFVLWIVDLVGWPSVRRPWPLLVSLSLVTANGAATGLACVVLMSVQPRRRSRPHFSIVTGLVAALLVVAARKTHDLADTLWARVAIAVIAAGIAIVLVWGFGTLARSLDLDRAVAWMPSCVLATLGGGLLTLDRLVFAAVAPLYSTLEGVAHILLGLACATLLVVIAPPRSSRRLVLRVLALTACTWLAVFALSRPLRRLVERYLPGVWDEAVYAPRWLRRARRLESSEASRAELARLSVKYQIDVPIAVDESWRATSRADVLAPTPHTAPTWNVIVYFVDTLREDVVRDPSIMPTTLQWSKENIVFTRAYASGSSTLLTLAPMMSCRYDATLKDSPRLLDGARAAGMTTAVVIPRHAYDYHRATFPAFRFEHEVIAEGAVPVARPLVQSALSWLRNRDAGSRFLLWVYQHDVHAWGDLGSAVVDGHAREARFNEHEGVHWHYRAAARGVDQAFGELLRGVNALGLRDNTVIVFASDHGEALGEKDFWTHSTHLWESLIHVPLIVSVPSLGAATIDSPVSTIDLVPTLAPFIGGSMLAAPPCHGTNVLASPESRPFPILFSAMTDGRLARVGMLSGTERKLVVDLGANEARLFRVSTREEDVTHERSEELTLRLNEIVRAPLFLRED